LQIFGLDVFLCTLGSLSIVYKRFGIGISN